MKKEEKRALESTSGQVKVLGGQAVVKEKKSVVLNCPKFIQSSRFLCLHHISPKHKPNCAENSVILIEAK